MGPIASAERLRPHLSEDFGVLEFLGAQRAWVPTSAPAAMPSQRLRPHLSEDTESERRCRRQFAAGVGPRRQ